MVPSFVIFLDTIDPEWQVDRALPTPDAVLALTDMYVAPNSVETVAGIWPKSFGSRVGVNDNFSVRGHSPLATGLSANETTGNADSRVDCSVDYRRCITDGGPPSGGVYAGRA
jgi:hypothetical protein